MLGYLGPAGTFTHQALLTLTGEESTPFDTVRSALEAVRAGEIEAALVPIENSVEGGVSATLDYLAHGDRLVITAEVLLSVQFGLYVRQGTTLAAVRRVLTHSHAAAQTRDWLARHVPEATITDASSTAAAAAEVANPVSRYDAAVCAPIAGEMYGLAQAASDIADNGSAITRFVLVAPAGTIPERTGADKTTLGSYFFSIDAEGHIRDARIAEALMGLHRVCKDVIFLGSYRRADGQEPTIPYGATDEDYLSASRWLTRLRGR